jgi:glycosyltransferase involved in cell wall biosynthesis
MTRGVRDVSIVIETSNLSSAELDNLSRCLESLAGQSIPMDDVHEVVVLESGDAGIEDLRAVCEPFPWVQMRSIPEGTRYGDVKALAAEVTEGELIVMCDADCRYEPGWLDALVAPFDERDDVQIASGETTTPVRGPYGLAIAITFVFPRFSGESGLQPALFYWANNVAVRRSFVSQIPLPKELPLFRGQTIVHAKALLDAGHTIWRNPRARAMHELPTVSELTRRFMLKGHDSLTLNRLTDDRSGHSYMGGMEPREGTQGRFANFAARVRSVFAEDRRRLVLLPIALPICGWIVGAYFVGRMRAQLRRAPLESLPSRP